MTRDSGQHGRRGVEHPDAERPGALGHALGVGALPPAVEQRLGEPPQRVGGEPDGQRDEGGLAPRLGGELAQHPLAVRRLAALAERDLQGEDADERVAHPLGHEPEAPGVLDRRRRGRPRRPARLAVVLTVDMVQCLPGRPVPAPDVSARGTRRAWPARPPYARRVPELLEVETYRRQAEAVVGRTIAAAEAPDAWFVKGSGPGRGRGGGDRPDRGRGAPAGQAARPRPRRRPARPGARAATGCGWDSASA